MKLTFNPPTFYTLEIYADVLDHDGKHGPSSLCVAWVFDWVKYKEDNWFGSNASGLGDGCNPKACGITSWEQIEPQVAEWIAANKDKTWDELPHMIEAG
jgi:hypothetical protein